MSQAVRTRILTVPKASLLPVLSLLAAIAGGVGGTVLGVRAPILATLGGLALALLLGLGGLLCLFTFLLFHARTANPPLTVGLGCRARRHGWRFWWWFVAHSALWTAAGAGLAVALLRAFGSQQWAAATAAGLLACSLYHGLGLLAAPASLLQQRRNLLGLCWYSAAPDAVAYRLARADATVFLGSRLVHAEEQAPLVLSHLAALLEEKTTHLLDLQRPLRGAVGRELRNRLLVCAGLFTPTLAVAWLLWYLGLFAPPAVLPPLPDWWSRLPLPVQAIIQSPQPQMALNERQPGEPDPDAQPSSPDSAQDANDNNGSESTTNGPNPGEAAGGAGADGPGADGNRPGSEREEDGNRPGDGVGESGDPSPNEGNPKPGEPSGAREQGNPGSEPAGRQPDGSASAPGNRGEDGSVVAGDPENPGKEASDGGADSPGDTNSAGEPNDSSRQGDPPADATAEDGALPATTTAGSENGENPSSDAGSAEESGQDREVSTQGSGGEGSASDERYGWNEGEGDVPPPPAFLPPAGEDAVFEMSVGELPQFTGRDDGSDLGVAEEAGAATPALREGEPRSGEPATGATTPAQRLPNWIAFLLQP